MPFSFAKKLPGKYLFMKLNLSFDGLWFGKEKRRRRESDRMDLPCLIAKQFCISLASVLSFLENLTICFFNPGLNNKRQKSLTIISNALIVFKISWGFPPFSLSPDKLWDWKSQLYSHIYTIPNGFSKSSAKKQVDERQQLCKQQQQHVWGLLQEGILFFLQSQPLFLSTAVWHLRYSRYNWVGLSALLMDLVKKKGGGSELWIYKCCRLQS